MDRFLRYREWMRFAELSKFTAQSRDHRLDGSRGDRRHAKRQQSR